MKKYDTSVTNLWWVSCLMIYNSSNLSQVLALFATLSRPEWQKFSDYFAVETRCKSFDLNLGTNISHQVSPSCVFFLRRFRSDLNYYEKIINFFNSMKFWPYLWKHFILECISKVLVLYVNIVHQIILYCLNFFLQKLLSNTSFIYKYKHTPDNTVKFWMF